MSTGVYKMSGYEEHLTIKELRKMVKTLAKSGHYTDESLTELLLNIGILASHDSFSWGIHIRNSIDNAEIVHKNISEEVEELVLSTDGQLSSTFIYNCLQLSTRNEKKAVSASLRRLKDKGIIEPYGDKAGVFRKIDKSFEPITEFKEEDTLPVDLLFPLGLERYARIFQSNVIVVSGEKDTGKTGFCLSFATMNRGNGHRIRYISSEFGSAELLDRLSHMDIDPDVWIKQIQFGQFMRNDAQDAIDPEAINIVDFLEIQEGKFFMISEQIKKIYQKLTTGVVLIAIQKKRGQDYGRGGELSAEKSRLYLTLSREKIQGISKNVATILHCKNRAMPETNPNGLYCTYKLGGGHYFKREDIWLPR